MKNEKVIDLPAQPVPDGHILWFISVGKFFPKEKLSIDFKPEDQVWIIKICARTFESAEVMKEQAQRRFFGCCEVLQYAPEVKMQ